MLRQVPWLRLSHGGEGFCRYCPLPTALLMQARVQGLWTEATGACGHSLRLNRISAAP